MLSNYNIALSCGRRKVKALAIDFFFFFFQKKKNGKRIGD